MAQIHTLGRPQPALQLRQNLAALYRICGHLGLDDLTYTHMSARLPGEDCYYIYPFGLLFEEVKASDLLKVDLDGTILEGSEYQYNKTGYIMHGGVYQARPDVNAIIHLHTTASVAVSIMECGLLPISQHSLHFYNRMAYHRYDSLALDGTQHGSQLSRDLGQHKAMMLQNHGLLTCGATIEEAFLYMHFLEQACRIQCTAMAAGTPLVTPPAEVCEQAALDMRAFEPDFGARDWQALIRKMDRLDPSYRD